MGIVYMGNPLVFFEGQFPITIRNAHHELMQRFFAERNATIEVVDGTVKVCLDDINCIKGLNDYLLEYKVCIDNPSVLDVDDPGVIEKKKELDNLVRALQDRQQSSNTAAELPKIDSKSSKVITYKDSYILSSIVKLLQGLTNLFKSGLLGSIDPQANFDVFMPEVVTPVVEEDPAKVQTLTPGFDKQDKVKVTYGPDKGRRERRALNVSYKIRT